jgi:hypothetical protein
MSLWLIYLDKHGDLHNDSQWTYYRIGPTDGLGVPAARREAQWKCLR